MSEEFSNITDRQTHRHTEGLPELLVGAKNTIQKYLRSITVTWTRESPEFRMRVVAARSIKEGEQIYNSYIDILDPVQVRRSHLALTKHMDCR